MTKNEMRTSLKLINSYVKQEFPNIKEITIVNYEPLISDYTIRFRVITDDTLRFSERYKISKYVEMIFNIFGYNVNCEVIFQYKSSE
jgi:hypothetical protein